jgi:hypothetical protein
MRSIALIALLLCAACGSGGDSDSAGGTDSLTSAPAAAQPADSAAPAISRPDTAWRLRFDGLGPVRVGMTVDEARAALGGDLALTPDNPQHPEGPDRCDYPRSARLPSGVKMMVQGQRVARMEVDSGAVSTAEGAKIGDTEARVQELYAGRVTVQPHKYTNGHYLVVRSAAAADTTHLLVFETDGRVVQRFRAGQKPQVEWVEGCS